jgi:hypothetical protein
MSAITIDSLDEIKIVDSAGDELAINADGSLNAVISATDLDIRDLTHVSDSIKIGDGTEFLLVNVDGSINVVATATDFDIRDLSASQDNVAISDGTDTLAVNADGSINSVVSATDLDIRDLSHASDSIKIGDGTDFLAIETDGSINVNFSADADDAAATYNPIGVGGVSADTASALGALSAAGDRGHLLMDLYRRLMVRDSNDVAYKVTQATVSTTESEVVGTPLAGRKSVIIQNVGNNDVYLKEATGVSTANGIKIPKKASMSFSFGEALNLFMIADTASSDVRILEAA